MDLKRRLLIAFLIIIMLPCAMIGTIGTVILSNQVKSLGSYGTETGTIQMLVEPVQILTRMTRSTFNELCTVSERYPERMEKEEWLAGVNEILSERFSFLVVLREGEPQYIGNRILFENIRSRIPENLGAEAAYDGGVYVGGAAPFLIRQQTFCFPDGAEGCFYIITNVTSLVRQLREAMTHTVFLGILAIVLTAGVLVAWLYQGIIKPLTTLRKATRQLAEGNLDYHVEGNAEDEIGQLCNDFEEMRIHLKEQIEVRIQYEQNLKEMISNISHDLKTPLTTIKGYTEGLLDGVADTPEKQEKYLKTIFAKASDMTALVEELSFYSKIDTDNLPFHPEAIPAEDYFRDCVEDFRTELELKGFSLSFRSEVLKDVCILADGEQLRRVMNNIIGNAVKYGGFLEGGGSIEIRLKEAGEFVLVEVSDCGQGISEQDLPHIFERFYRADRSRNTRQGGTGLGLSIVKRIIEEHGGTIGAESTPGKGTTLWFTLKKEKMT